MMRPPFYISLVIGGILVLSGLHTGWRLDELREDRERLEARAVADGWRLGKGSTGEWVRGNARVRPDRLAEGRLAVAAVMDYTRGLPFPDDFPETERLRRVSEETERIQRMDGAQLRELIDELREAEALDEKVRGSLLEFALGELAHRDPKKALTLAVEMRDQLKSHVDLRRLLNDLMKTWAMVDPASGKEWLERLAGSLEEVWEGEMDRGLIKGALVGDPLLALEWLAGKGWTVNGFLKQEEWSLEQRLAILSSMRVWEARPGGGTWVGTDRASSLQVLVLGNGKGRKLELVAFYGFWKKAHLRPDEVRELAVTDLAAAIHPAESGSWFEWIGGNLPDEEAQRLQAGLLRHPSTAGPLREWLSVQPAEVRERWDETVRGRNIVDASPGTYPVADPVPGKPGFVFSPDTNQAIDVRGLPSGTLVMDPSSPRTQFRVP